ncbi:MAG TPA: hypothetical protein VF032_05755 [Thermoleophilaceae bacterium]
MRIWPALLLAGALAVPANALAVSRPHYAESYRGTISGSFESHDAGRDVKGQWKIGGLVFRLYKVSAFEGGFTGLYKVTAGKVSYSETESGDCSYSVSDTFALKKWLPHPLTSVSLALDKDPLGRMTTLGLIDVRRKLSVTESCADSQGGPPATEQRELQLPTLFDPAETSWKPGRRLHHRRSERQDNGKQTFSWNLKPGR